MSHTACPLLEEPIDENTVLLHGGVAEIISGWDVLSYFFSPSLQSLVCLHNLLCHNMAIFTSRFCVDWRLVGVLCLFFFPNKTMMQLWFQNTLARATGRTATLALQRTHTKGAVSKKLHKYLFSFELFLSYKSLRKTFFSRRFLCDTPFRIFDYRYFLAIFSFHLIPPPHWRLASTLEWH